VRAKRWIRDAGIPFRLPDPSQSVATGVGEIPA